MARPLRIELAGAFYHVMARGNARQSIFKDARDREAFLRGVQRVCERCHWRIWAYCLMDNHYHLLTETLEPTLSRGMREINGLYTQGFNRRHQRVGHVLQGRYKALLVDQDVYLLEVSRYIVLNPVNAGVCRAAGDYKWSNYRATLGREAAPAWLAVADTLRLFSTDKRRAREAYRRFVAKGVGAPDPTTQAQGQCFLGDEHFITKVTRHLKRPSREVPKSQRAWKTLSTYERETHDRNAAIRTAYASGSYTLGQIGQHFNLHYATVSRIARNG